MTAVIDQSGPAVRALSNPVLERITPHLGDIAAAAAEGEQARAVPPRIVATLREAGVFKMALPQIWGGGHLGLVDSADVIESIARADGSAGWISQVGSMISAFLRSLPREVLDDVVFAEGADKLFRGAVAPKGKAIAVDGGFRLSGRWPLASGAYRPDWMLGGFMVADAPPLRSDGFPDIRVALFTPEQVTFLDTWDAVGLRGTQSHDFTMDDVFIPLEHTGSLFVGNNMPAPMYDLPYSPTGSSHDAVVLGIVRGALDDLGLLAREKRPAFNPRVLLGEDPVFQESFGLLELRMLALSALHQETTAAVMASALAGTAPAPLEWGRYVAATQHIHHEGMAIVNDVMSLAGAGSIYHSASLQRRWRDLRCVSQHVAANNGMVRRLGAALSGQAS